MSARLRGFTLLELVVTVAVLGIALAVALPSFTALRERVAALNAFHAVTGSLMSARMAAVSRGHPVTVCPSADGLTCRLDLVWDEGWLVYRDPGRQNHPADAGDVLWVFRGPGAGLALRGTPGRHRVRYQPTGFAGGNNLSLRLCARRGPRLLGSLVVNLVGRARSQWENGAEPTVCPYTP